MTIFFTCAVYWYYPDPFFAKLVPKLYSRSQIRTEWIIPQEAFDVYGDIAKKDPVNETVDSLLCFKLNSLITIPLTTTHIYNDWTIMTS